MFAGIWFVELGVRLGAGLESGTNGVVTGSGRSDLGDARKGLVGLLIVGEAKAAFADTVTLRRSLTAGVDCPSCSLVRSMERSLRKMFN